MPRIVPFLAIVCAAAMGSLCAYGASPEVEAAADRASLLKGVEQIGVPGVPGALSVFGPRAFAVIAGKSGKEAFLPVVAGARWEKGRVFAFGHDGYLGLTEGGTGTLHVNAVRWAAGDQAPAKLKVAVRGLDKLAAHLEAAGFHVETVRGDAWTRRLGGSRVLCVDSRTLSEKDVAPLAAWIRGGGGLVTAGTGWGWVQTNPGKTIQTDHPGNQLMAPAGLVFSEQTPERTAPDGYVADTRDLSLLNAGTALEAIVAADAQPAAPKTALTQAGTTLSDALRSIPVSDTLLLPRMKALASRPEAAVLPTAEQPLKQEQALARLLLTRDLQLSKDAAPEAVRPHPAAQSFPGAVAANAPRVSDRALTINTKIPAWHSTGLYAPPGEVIRVQVPPNAATAGLGIRIGCHTDTLWHHSEWKRVPEITRTEKITTATAAIANPFGGLVYIDVPKGCSLGEVKVSISGAIEAPHFVLGKTRADEWLTRIRQAPAPWAELETPNIILTVPSSAIRSLENPEELMRFWDNAMNAIADLASIPRQRERAERIVADVQISAGYMHSGYPIMTHLDAGAVERSLSLEQLKQQGSWGHFHELGHNHQVSDWTFSGTGEVTCNLFSFYCSEMVAGLAPGEGHDAMEPNRVAERLKKHLATRANFQRWKDDPFLALIMYYQLRTAFGWEPYKKVFAEYQTLSRAERPKNDDEKRDQWMVRFSRTIGKNLGPFFQAWGVPTSESARASIQDLPAWMPEDWPKM
ncbi:MAG: M60 family metallopeptidase [Chthoniobacteraceae bacterium]